MKYSEAQALSKLAAYCSKAERAEFDVRRKAEGWELPAEAISRIISRLKNEKFLDEERYCRSFINDKAKFNKWGESKIRFELRKKKIPEAVISFCLQDFESERFDQPLFDLLSAKIKTVKATSDYELNTKLIRFALGRGYSFDQIKKTLQKLNLNDEECPEPPF